METKVTIFFKSLSYFTGEIHHAPHPFGGLVGTLPLAKWSKISKKEINTHKHLPTMLRFVLASSLFCASAAFQAPAVS
jgi:hypothetical protein